MIIKFLYQFIACIICHRFFTKVNISYTDNKHKKPMAVFLIKNFLLEKLFFYFSNFIPILEIFVIINIMNFANLYNYIILFTELYKNKFDNGKLNIKSVNSNQFTIFLCFHSLFLELFYNALIFTIFLLYFSCFSLYLRLR